MSYNNFFDLNNSYGNFTFSFSQQKDEAPNLEKIEIVKPEIVEDVLDKNMASFYLPKNPIKKRSTIDIYDHNGNPIVLYYFRGHTKYFYYLNAIWIGMWFRAYNEKSKGYNEDNLTNVHPSWRYFYTFAKDILKGQTIEVLNGKYSLLKKDISADYGPDNFIFKLRDRYDEECSNVLGRATKFKSLPEEYDIVPHRSNSYNVDVYIFKDCSSYPGYGYWIKILKSCHTKDVVNKEKMDPRWLYLHHYLEDVMKDMDIDELNRGVYRLYKKNRDLPYGPNNFVWRKRKESIKV